MNKFFLMLSFIALAGCSSTCHERVYVTQVAIDDLVDTTADMYETGSITKEAKDVDVAALRTANDAAHNAALMCTLEDPSYKDYLNQAVDAYSNVSAIFKVESPEVTNE